MTTPLIVLDIIKIMFDILNLKFKYFGFTAIIKTKYKLSFLLNIYKYLKFMNDKTATLPKNTILNFLYSTDRQVSLELLGNWLEKHTEGRYKLVDTHQYIENSDNNKHLANCA